jgi:hypothetical protein
MVSNYEVAKLYAEGKTKGKSNNVFIDGDTIYSYGHHFPMAKKVNEPDVDYLYNSDEYSPTTGKHQSYVRGCLGNKRLLEIKDCNLSNAQKQKESNLNDIVIHKKKLVRARVPHSKVYHEDMIKHYEEQNKLLERYIPQTE